MALLKRMIQKLMLMALFAAALNLSLQVTFPDQDSDYISSGSYIDEKAMIVLPFGEREVNQTAQILISLQSLPFSFITKWAPLKLNKITLELFYRSGNPSFKEYPFNVLVRNLRI